jgi:hypothetical protein
VPSFPLHGPSACRCVLHRASRLLHWSGLLHQSCVPLCRIEFHAGVELRVNEPPFS